MFLDLKQKKTDTNLPVLEAEPKIPLLQLILEQ